VVTTTYHRNTGGIWGGVPPGGPERPIRYGEATASALGLLTVEQQVEQIVVIPARGFALASHSCLDGFVLA